MKKDLSKIQSDVENAKLVEHKIKIEIDSLKTLVVDCQKEIDRKELDLKTDEGEISKFNVKLNTIKTNKEYTALCSEIGSKKADMSILEDVILNTMSRLEIVNKEYSELTENLKHEEESLKELIKSVDADVRETDIEIEKVQNDQKKYIDSLDEDTLYHYSRLSNIKGGKAVVAVMGNVCGGCFMNITAQTLNLLIRLLNILFLQN